jgi:hypothetical protein
MIVKIYKVPNNICSMQHFSKEMINSMLFFFLLIYAAKSLK